MDINEIPSILPSAHLPEKARNAIRFMVVGTLGMFVQEWFFRLLMWLMNEPVKDSVVYYIAFALGNLLEMFPNYFMTNWYTFQTRPNLTNAGGFILARGINLVLQMVFLPFVLRLMPDANNTIITYVVIFVAGIVNFLIQYFFFKKKV
ncbi:MAG: GtrA family protein [Paludibacteraceae bacterium]|nr:GtrA family protein [Paludibacteraceae bacterium]